MNRTVSVDRSDIVLHCFGAPGSGGPATALARLQEKWGHRYPEVWQREGAAGLSVALLRSFVRQFRELRPRLVHVRGLGNEGFHAALAAKLAGVPNILVSVHGTQRDLERPNGRFRRWIVVNILERLTLILATNVVTVCESAARRDFLDPYRSKLLDPVPNGVPLPQLPDPRGRAVRRSLEIAADALVLITVSRLSVEKGYEDLAEALRRLDRRERAFHLIVVGGGREEEAIRALFEPLVNVRVHFVGHQADVGPFLSASDVFVFPSWRENLSNALLEGMSYALPVVATDVGGNREVVSKGGGLLVPAHAPAALADAILEMLEDDDLGTVGRSARATVEDWYSIERMSAAWEARYRQIMGA